MSHRKIVCLCGSTRFKKEFEEAEYNEAMAGSIVLSVAFAEQYQKDIHPDIKRQLDLLHLDKIDLAHEVYVINVGGYIGDSTRREIAYAFHTGKPIRSLVPLTDDEIQAIIYPVPLPVRNYV